MIKFQNSFGGINIKYDFDEIFDRSHTNSIKWDSISDNSGTIPMHIADMDFKCPQFIIEALENRVRHGFYGYTQRGALYYESIIGWMDKRHNCSIKKEWICGINGVIPSIICAVNAFTEPGDKVIVQTPVYYPFRSIVLNNKREVVENRLEFKNGKYSMNLDELETKIDDKVKIFLLCSPHNPVGRVWSAKELKDLGDICAKKNILIVSDEIHGDIVYWGHKHIPTICVSDELASRTITCMSPSKTFNLAGLTTSYAIIPNQDLYESFTSTMSRMGMFQNNIFGLAALEAVYTYGGDWLEQLMGYLQENLSYLRGYLEESIPEIKLIKPEGTYLAWLDLRDAGIDSREVNKYLKNKARVYLEDGQIFGSGGEGFQRMNIAYPRMILKEALERIKKCYSENSFF